MNSFDRDPVTWYLFKRRLDMVKNASVLLQIKFLASVV